MNDELQFDINYELANLIDEHSLTDGDILPISKKFTKSFRRYYYEELLAESPQRQYGLADFTYDNWSFNGLEAHAFVSGEKGEFIDFFHFKGYKVSIYKKDSVFENAKTIEYILVFNESKAKNIFGFVRIIPQIINNETHFFTRGIWNSQTWATGLIFAFFTKWLLPKFKLIISDNITTKLGENFWWKVIEYGLANNKECGIFADPSVINDKTKCFRRFYKKEDFEKAWEYPARLQRIYIKE